jgi:glucose/arabinose dehydrogenase
MHRTFLLLAALALAVAPLACAAPTEEWPPATGIVATLVAEKLADPLFVTAPPGDPRLFVVEQGGRIRVIKAGKVLPAPFLDVSARITSGGERGLLGLAFHPGYAKNGTFYVNWTNRDGDTEVVRFRVSADPDRADAASAGLILKVAQPYANHNGGMIAFAPDGKLWIGMGDGGSGGDPQGNGQNRRALLGKMLRLDVDGAAPYAIPPDNPYANGREGRPEIWASGLRNPWRFSFDRGSKNVYIADVGQNKWEEVNVADATRPGLDYGWNLREGMHAYGAPRVTAEKLVEPVAEYGHNAGCSVTGGYCYRGRALGAAMQGTYFFSDYCNGWLRSFRWDGTRAADKRQWRVGELGNITSFGEDAAGELHVTTSQGRVWRLDPGK